MTFERVFVILYSQMTNIRLEVTLMRSALGHSLLNIRNRRLLLIAVVLMILLALILLFGKGTSMGSAEATTVKEKMYTSIEVQYGDTLWSLAEEYGQEYADPSVFIREVSAINKLSGDRITAGACLFIPVYR